MIESLTSAFQQYQLGTIPGWGLLVTALLFWWKGLPGLITAWEARSQGIENRLDARMAAYVERTTQQLADSDKRYNELERHHQECREDQDKLRERVGLQDTTIAQQNQTIASQSQTIMGLTDQVNALKTSNVQQQIAAVEASNPSPTMRRMIDGLKEVK